MFKNNLKIAFRSLMRRRMFTAINITGLALGMAAAIFAFLWSQNEFSFDQFHPKANNLYRVNMDLQISGDNTWHFATSPLPLVNILKTEVPEALTTTTLLENPWKPFILKNGDLMLNGKRATYVDENWFDLFDHQIISGSTAHFQDKIQSAILTRNFAEKLFGKWQVVGETFFVWDTEFVVQAIIENHPPNSSFSYEIVLPLSYYLSIPANKNNEIWNNANMLTFVELHPNTNQKTFDEKLTNIIQKERESDAVSLSIQPLSELHFDEKRASSAMATSNRTTAYMFAIIGFIILFLACVNYVSLTTAQAGMRTREVGVRKIIGADGKQIFRLIFTESLLTTCIALCLALSIVQLGLPFFNSFAENQFQLTPTNPTIWLVCGGTLLAALLLSGIYPALFLTGFSPSNFLQGQNFLKLKNTTFRKGLVVIQFAITVGLIIGAIVIFQQQDFISKKELGYEKSHVFEFVIPYNPQRQETINKFQQTLTASPAILGTAAANGSIINMNSTNAGSLDWEGKPEDLIPTVGQFSVDANFAELMQLELLDGRWFLPNNQTDGNNIILNETAVKEFQLKEPLIGQKISFGTEGQIIGIVKDFHYQSLHQKIAPLVLTHTPRSFGNVLVRTKEGQVAEAIAAAKAAWAIHNAEKPFEYQFLDDTFDRLYKTEAKHVGLFRLLAGLAIFISCLGLLGLAVFSTEQRHKEIGIRKVLGASIAGLVGLLSKDFLLLVLLSFLVAFPCTYFLMDNWLENFAYRIDIQWWVFMITGLFVIALSFLTVGLQSVKAAVANPINSLRSD